jgi:ADP-ribose pyrophosphatase YjhB (NUDIX family)
MTIYLKTATSQAGQAQAVNDPRSYPDRPYLAVSAAIIRHDRVLIVRRGRPPAQDVFTLPGGAVEVGESIVDAVIREVQEETGFEIEPVDLAGYREVILRDDDGEVERHFVVLCFAAQLLAGDPVPNEEIAEMRWVRQRDLYGLRTTEGLDEIIEAAFEKFDTDD